MLGRKTLKSERARARQIDRFFERTAQVMLLSYALFVFISWLSYRPIFHITEVVIDGLHAVSPDNIVTLTNNALSSRFLSRVFRNNMLFYPRERIVHDITMIDPRIASVSLAFDSRNTLRIVVHEHVVAALVCEPRDIEGVTTTLATSTGALATTASVSYESGRCYYADDRGYVFADAAGWSGYPYMTFISSSTNTLLRSYILPAQEFAALNRFLSLLYAANLRPHTVTILADNDFRIETMFDWDILWSSKNDPKEGIENLTLVLSSIQTMSEKDKKGLESIDLRFGNKIFYKNKGVGSRE